MGKEVAGFHLPQIDRRVIVGLPAGLVILALGYAGVMGVLNPPVQNPVGGPVSGANGGQEFLSLVTSTPDGCWRFSDGAHVQVGYRGESTGSLCLAGNRWQVPNAGPGIRGDLIVSGPTPNAQRSTDK